MYLFIFFILTHYKLPESNVYTSIRLCVCFYILRHRLCVRARAGWLRCRSPGSCVVSLGCKRKNRFIIMCVRVCAGWLRCRSPGSRVVFMRCIKGRTGSV